MNSLMISIKIIFYFMFLFLIPSNAMEKKNFDVAKEEIVIDYNEDIKNSNIEKINLEEINKTVDFVSVTLREANNDHSMQFELNNGHDPSSNTNDNERVSLVDEQRQEKKCCCYIKNPQFREDCKKIAYYLGFGISASLIVVVLVKLSFS